MRRCNSLGAYMNGPWRCRDYDCRGRREDCKALALNRAEAAWLERRVEENAWLEHYGLPVLTIVDARRAVGELLR